jgi:predicted membrane-bound mannosyltransferase
MEAVIVPLLIVIALLCARLERQAREVVALRGTVEEQNARIGHLRKAHSLACRDICALEDKLERLT